ncbi:MAG: shikimate kinase [Bacteroidetes bacterium]|nr:shikimate kinase [Bacteroidota bacterium]MBS1630668.1 shikimate kinase [Bacteroidota bacterium]
MNLLFLIGMPGVGKSFWGKVWARQHSWSFLDLDEQICAYAGRSISEIFASVGEEGFRLIESHVLEACIRGTGRVKTIVAVGGGCPCLPENLSLMQDAGCLIWLRAKTKTLLRQLRQSDEQRPLLGELSESVLEALEAERKIIYQAASIQIEVEKIHEDTFAQILKACTNLRS